MHKTFNVQYLVKKAYEPGFIRGILSDAVQTILGEPDFTSAYKNPELEKIYYVNPPGKPRGVYLDIYGLLKHLGDQRRSEVKIQDKEKKDIIQSRKHLLHKESPSIKTIYSDVEKYIPLKPIKTTELLPTWDTGAVYGLYYPGTDYIKVTRAIQDNFKQSLAIAALLKRIAEKKITIPKERETSLKRILYGAYISSGFLPTKNVDEFYNELLLNKDFRDRYIKALVYPAYNVALHESIHRNAFSRLDVDSPYAVSTFYKDPSTPAHALKLISRVKAIPEIYKQYMPAILNYTFHTAEIDPQLALTKRWYQIQTGRKVNSIEDARAAFEYIVGLVDKDERILDFLPLDVSNQYYSYSVNKFLLDSLEEYKKKYLKGRKDPTFDSIYSDVKTSFTAYLYRMAQL